MKLNLVDVPIENALDSSTRVRFGDFDLSTLSEVGSLNDLVGQASPDPDYGLPVPAVFQRFSETSEPR